jgi:hypothetical protein
VGKSAGTATKRERRSLGRGVPERPVLYDRAMAKTIETTMSEAQAELAGKPSLVELAARISQREPYSGPPVAPIVRQDRDAR